MSAKRHIALLMGGKSKEREVSLASGGEIMAHIDRDRFNVAVYDPVKDLSLLLDHAPRLDLAFLALHGAYGEDGTIQGFCELAGLPYIGSGVLASAMAIDKNVAKKIYREAGLPVARDLVLDKRTAGGGLADEARRAMDMLGAPVVVKPLRQGSSVGLSIVRDEGALSAALDEVFSLDGAAMLEEYLPGREFTCGVVGNLKTTALPIIEIIPAEGHQFFDYSAKYEPGQSEEICPADLTVSAAADISRLAVAAHLALGCRGLSRTDFILVDGRPFILETNTLPGMTSGSLLPKMAKTYGLSFTSFISYLIDLVLEPVEPDLDFYKV